MPYLEPIKEHVQHDSWEEIGTEGEQNYVLDECATYLDGQCYWMGHTSAGDDLIISLSLSSHEFSTLHLPPLWGSFPGVGIILTEFEKSLAFIIYERIPVGTTPKPKDVCCWVRVVDDEWVEKMSFEFGETERRPLRFCGDFLLFEGLDGGLLAYDLHKKLFRKIEGIHDYSNCMPLFPFFESKVPLSIEEKKGKSKKRKEMIKSKRKWKKKDKDGDVAIIT